MILHEGLRELAKNGIYRQHGEGGCDWTITKLIMDYWQLFYPPLTKLEWINKVGMTVEQGTEMREVGRFWQEQGKGVKQFADCGLERLRDLTKKNNNAVLVNIFDDRRDYGYPGDKDPPEQHTLLILSVDDGNNPDVEYFDPSTACGGILTEKWVKFEKKWHGGPDSIKWNDSDKNWENGSRQWAMVVS